MMIERKYTIGWLIYVRLSTRALQQRRSTTSCVVSDKRLLKGKQGGGGHYAAVVSMRCMGFKSEDSGVQKAATDTNKNLTCLDSEKLIKPSNKKKQWLYTIQHCLSKMKFKEELCFMWRWAETSILTVCQHRLLFCDKDWIICCRALVTHSSKGAPLKWEVSFAFNNASGNDWSNHRARSRHPPVLPILLSHKMQSCQAFTVRAGGTCWGGSNVLPRSLFSRSYLGLILLSHLLPRT